MGLEVSHDYAKHTVKFDDLFDGGHNIDRGVIHFGMFNMIEDKSVLLPFLDKRLCCGVRKMCRTN